MPGAEAAEFERRIVSVLFADLVGFTSLSEQLDPEDVATIQDAYFAAVRETIGRHGGVVEKFIGDAVMAVFGVPRARDDDAERAIRAGLALIGAVEALGARLGLTAGGLELRVGVNSGEVVSAESGPDTGRVTGDTVNLAARFQTAATPGTVAVGELSQLSAGDAVEFEPMGALELKGKAEPVPAWRVSGLRPERSREEALGALRAPLLGRAAELARLETALRATSEGRTAGNVVMVAPPGVGKSRLLTEFARRAESAGAQVLRARVRADVLGPSEPVGQLLLAALGGATRETAGAVLGSALSAAGTSPGRTAVVSQEVRDTLWPAATEDHAAVPDRDARFGAWLEALDALAGAQPSAWLIEDIHWAGGDLLAFLNLAGTAVTAAGRLVVATARPSVLEQLAPDTEVFELPPLPALNAAELVRALVGDALPAEVVDAIAERSDGNPLFIEELLRSWISAGTLVSEGAGWRLAVPPEAVPLPATVQAIYAAQLDDLPAGARLVARRASVAGRRFAVRALAPLEVSDPTEGLDRLRDRAFIRGPEADAGGDDIYAYRHALLRDAAYASLSRAERGRLHLALAGWLEQTAGSDVSRVAEPIASHYEAALAALPGLGANPDERDRLTDAARTWLERAADAALGVAAHDAAIALLARAIGLTEDGSLEMGRLRLRRGELLARSGDLALGITEIEAALAIGQEHYRRDGSEVARLLAGESTIALGDAMVEQVRFTEARDLATAALADIGQPEDALRGQLLALRAMANAMQGDREGTAEEAAEALALVATAAPTVGIAVRSRMASVLAETNQFGADDWRSLEEDAARLGQWGVVIKARTNRVLTANDPSSRRQTLAELEQIFDLAEAHGLTERAVWAQYTVAEACLALGDWDRALSEGLAAIDLGERNAYVRPVFRTWAAIIPILAARGETAILERYRQWWGVNGSNFPVPPSAYGLVMQGAIDHHLVTAGLEPVVGRPVPSADLTIDWYENADWLLSVETVFGGWLVAGDLESAASALPQVEGRVAGSEPQPRPVEHASQHLLAAWLAGAQGRTAEAVVAARAAAAYGRQAEAPWWVVRAIRALPEGEATAEELAEAADLEARLGVGTA